MGIQIKKAMTQPFEYIILGLLIWCIFCVIRYIIYKPKDKILYTKYLNIKIQYDFRFFIMLLSLYLALKRVLFHSDIIVGVYASAMVWGFVELVGIFLKYCATYETEKEKFYPEIYKKLGDIKNIIKNEFDNINYEKIKNEILDIYYIVINAQHEYSIYVLSDEYLGMHNYISALLEDFDTFYEKAPEELKKVIIIKSKQEIDNKNLDEELYIDIIDSIVEPTFSEDKIYKFHGVRAGNEGDLLNRISIGMPKSIKYLSTFKPTFEIDKYINSNNKLTYIEVFKIIFFLRWFK